MRVGIFGGSFNPIHNGHLMIAKNAISAAKLDKCLLVVANNPPHKHVDYNVPAQVRFDMSCTALSDTKDLPIYACNVEIINNLCYTCDMLSVLSQTNDFKDAEIYLIIGADMLNSFLTWRNPEKICSLIKGIIAVKRSNEIPEYDFEKSYEIITKTLGIDIIIINDVSNISSTAIRDAVINFEPISNMVPYETERFIYENGLYTNDYIRFIINDLRKSLGQKRFSHSVSTMRESILLADRYGADKQICAIAGLVHDCAKITGVDYLDLCEQYGIEADEYEKKSPALLHAKLGVYKAQTVYGIKDTRILNAIINHTVGAPCLDLISKIVYVADKIEVLREYPEAKQMRKTAYEDIDKAALETMNFNIDKLRMAEKPVHPATINAIEYYQNVCGGNKQ